MFKRTILTAIAVSMLAVPMAQAQSRHDGPRGNQHYSQPYKSGPATQRNHMRKPAPQRHHAQRPAPRSHNKWTTGHRVPQWQHRQQVRDYHRYGLRKPARGQQWVKIDNDYLLISLATGVIFGMAASR